MVCAFFQLNTLSEAVLIPDLQIWRAFIVFVIRQFGKFGGLNAVAGLELAISWHLALRLIRRNIRRINSCVQIARILT